MFHTHRFEMYATFQWWPYHISHGCHFKWDFLNLDYIFKHMHWYFFYSFVIFCVIIGFLYIFKCDVLVFQQRVAEIIKCTNTIIIRTILQLLKCLQILIFSTESSITKWVHEQRTNWFPRFCVPFPFDLWKRKDNPKVLVHNHNYFTIFPRGNCFSYFLCTIF